MDEDVVEDKRRREGGERTAERDDFLLLPGKNVE